MSQALISGHWEPAVIDDGDEPSDPEEGAEWSSESDSDTTDDARTGIEEPVAGPSVLKRAKQAAGPLPPKAQADRTRAQIASPVKTDGPSTVLSPSQPRASESSFHSQSIGDRKRAASSSSAFGSKARVRFLNLRKANRRRPLSLQAALRSLTSSNESEDLAALARDHRRQGMGPGHERRSFQGPAPVSVPAHAATDDLDDTGAAPHSSAPAATPSTSVPMQATSDVQRPHNETQAELGPPHLSASQERMPPPQHFPRRTSPLQAAGEQRPELDKGKEQSLVGSRAVEAPADDSVQKSKPKFFLSSSGGKSFEDEDDQENQDAHKPKSGSPSGPPVLQGSENVTQKSTAPTGAASTAAVRPGKTKSEASHKTAAGLTGAHHNRSSSNLPKTGKMKQGSRQGSSGRLSALHGLTMTKTQPHPSAAPRATQAAAGKGVPGAGTGSALQSEAARKSNERPSKSRPVKFDLGPAEDEDDDADYTDEEDDVLPVEASKTQPTVNQKSQPIEEEVVDDDDDDAWSSDASAEAEEERRRIQRVAEKRHQLEKERQSNMFKKVPIRSKSAADVRLPTELEPKANSRPTTAVAGEASTPVQPAVRGLLTSLFHPDEAAQFPPGQLHGRPHASAADLRHVPNPKAPPPRHEKHSSRTTKASKDSDERRSTHHHRPPSLISGTPGGSTDNGGPLRTSKSAAALPVLNIAPSAVSGGQSGPEEVPFSSGSLVQQAEVASGAPETQRSHHSRQRSRHDSSNSTESVPLQDPVTTPTVAAHRNALPAPIAPQSPRTTRRNMLRDELSESLRQNLLWERQSRNRMLGIGANGPREASTQQQTQQGPPAPTSRPPRRETVLGNNLLRPLTQGPGPGQPTTSTSGRPPATGSTEEHRNSQKQEALASKSNLVTRAQHSRSTPSLPGAGAEAQRQQHRREELRRQQSAQLSSAETSDDEGSGARYYEPSRRGSRADLPASASSSSAGRDESTGTLRAEEGGAKRKAMWSGGFPNYHQHGW